MKGGIGGHIWHQTSSFQCTDVGDKINNLNRAYIALPSWKAGILTLQLDRSAICRYKLGARSWSEAETVMFTSRAIPQAL